MEVGLNHMTVETEIKGSCHRSDSDRVFFWKEGSSKVGNFLGVKNEGDFEEKSMAARAWDYRDRPREEDHERRQQR